MIIAVTLIVLCLLVGAILAIEDRDPFLLVVSGICAGVILGVWLLVAWPLSTYVRHSCERVAEGYGLDPDRVDWSIRNNCRVTLPSGQLVPEGSIRVTSDGRIFAG